MAKKKEAQGAENEELKEQTAPAPEEQTKGSDNAEAEEKAGQTKTEKKKEPTPLEKAEALAEDYKRKWYSVSAEYDNYRKRNASAVSKAYADGAAEAVLKLLPVADNFGYAYDSASDEKTKAGIDKVIKGFNNVLASLGVEEIPVSVGDLFDESVMEAVLNFPCEDGESVNTVKTVLKKGYRSGEKVIRFVQVAVTV